MSKLYSKEDVNTDKRLGCLEDALNEIYERLEELERKTKPIRRLKAAKKTLVSTSETVTMRIRNGAKNAGK